MSKASAEIRSYELTYLLPVGFTDSELTKLKAGIQAVLEKYQAKVTTTEDWGKQRMAYSIKHNGKMHTDAVYVHVVFDAEPSKVQALEKEIFLQTQLLRHLLVVAVPYTAPVAKMFKSREDGEEVTATE